jgi:hypothetical protein
MKITFAIQTGYHPERMPGVLHNIVDTADKPEELEVVIQVHKDDPASHNFNHPRLIIKTFVFNETYTSSEKAKYIFENTTGEILSGMSDDFIIHTPGWDTKIKEIYEGIPDRIALVGVNDLMFKDTLFTIPIMSRRAVEIVGYSIHPAYQYYRVDDHIHHTYDILRRLGHDRIIYREDIVFEHNHYTMIAGKRVYTKSLEATVSNDGVYYQMLEGQRKIDALKLAMAIDNYDYGLLDRPEKPRQYCEKLTKINDGLTNFVRVD